MNQRKAIELGIDGLLFLKTHFNSPDYDEAIVVLRAIQMGLDGESDVLARDWNTPEEDAAWKCLDEKAEGWRESEHHG